MIPMTRVSPHPNASTETTDRRLSDAFCAIFQAELPYVVNSLRRLGVPRVDVDDLAHEVFLAVYRRLDGYDETRPLRPWLFGIAFRVASDYRRLARHRREETRAEVEAVDPSSMPDEELAKRQAQAIVLLVLDTMPMDRRVVFIMHDIDGHPASEIAEALSIPINTAYSRLRLARADFAQGLQRIQRGRS